MWKLRESSANMPSQIGMKCFKFYQSCGRVQSSKPQAISHRTLSDLHWRLGSTLQNKRGIFKSQCLNS